jgi:beta-lactamase class A
VSEGATRSGGPRGERLAALAGRHLARIGGRVALALSLADGSTLARDADTPYLAASVIKVPLLAVALRRAEAGELDLGERVTIDGAHVAGGSGILAELDPGLAPTWRDLLTLMIVLSDNTATNLVMARLGVEAVNAELVALGFPGTRLAGPLQVEPSRYTAAQRRGERARTTAREVHDLLVRLDDGDLAGPDATAWARSVLVRQRHRSGLPRFLTGDETSWAGVTVGAKGGWLDSVRHDAALVWDEEGRRLATLVLLSAEQPLRMIGPDDPVLVASARLARDAIALLRPGSRVRHRAPAL